MRPASSDIAVVIPFYQTRPGILRRAVESALNQQGVETPRVVVVDDESPVDARLELADLLAAFPQHIEVLRQANAGPGGARNLGIRHVAENVEFVAFLDSDDLWEPDHLRVALAALTGGADFYFCDSVRESRPSVFATKHFPDTDCALIRADPHLYRYCGDLPQLILDRCPIATPAVVYRPRNLPFLFREHLRTAGEDYFFWLEVAYSGRPVAFSTQRNARLGDGVNIHAGVEWGTNAAVVQTYFRQLYVREIGRSFPLTSGHRLSCRRQTRLNREKIAQNVCSIVGRGKTLDLATFGRYAALDPAVLGAIPYHLARRAGAYVLEWFAVSSIGRKGK